MDSFRNETLYRILKQVQVIHLADNFKKRLIYRIGQHEYGGEALKLADVAEDHMACMRLKRRIVS